MRPFVCLPSTNTRFVGTKFSQILCALYVVVPLAAGKQNKQQMNDLLRRLFITRNMSYTACTCMRACKFLLGKENTWSSSMQPSSELTPWWLSVLVG